MYDTPHNTRPGTFRRFFSTPHTRRLWPNTNITTNLALYLVQSSTRDSLSILTMKTNSTALIVDGRSYESLPKAQHLPNVDHTLVLERIECLTKISFESKFYVWHHGLCDNNESSLKSYLSSLTPLYSLETPNHHYTSTDETSKDNHMRVALATKVIECALGLYRNQTFDRVVVISDDNSLAAAMEFAEQHKTNNTVLHVIPTANASVPDLNRYQLTNAANVSAVFLDDLIGSLHTSSAVAEHGSTHSAESLLPISAKRKAETDSNCIESNDSRKERKLESVSSQVTVNALSAAPVVGAPLTTQRDSLPSARDGTAAAATVVSSNTAVTYGEQQPKHVPMALRLRKQRTSYFPQVHGGPYWQSRLDIVHASLVVSNGSVGVTASAGVNGVYTADGTMNGAARFELEGMLTGLRGRYVIYRCMLNNKPHSAWFLSFVAHATQLPGTPSDHNLYYSRCEPENSPVPLSTWYGMTNKFKDEKGLCVQVQGYRQLAGERPPSSTTGSIKPAAVVGKKEARVPNTSQQVVASSATVAIPDTVCGDTSTSSTAPPADTPSERPDPKRSEMSNGNFRSIVASELPRSELEANGGEEKSLAAIVEEAIAPDTTVVVSTAVDLCATTTGDISNSAVTTTQNGKHDEPSVVLPCTGGVNCTTDGIADTVAAPHLSESQNTVTQNAVELLMLSLFPTISDSQVQSHLQQLQRDVAAQCRVGEEQAAAAVDLCCQFVLTLRAAQLTLLGDSQAPTVPPFPSAATLDSREYDEVCVEILQHVFRPLGAEKVETRLFQLFCDTEQLLGEGLAEGFCLVPIYLFCMMLRRYCTVW